MLRDNPNLNHPRNNSGFSLTELLVVIVMVGIMMTAGYNLYREQNRINQAQQNILEVQSSGRAALQILIQAFSHAGFGCSENISASNNVAGEGNYLNPTNQNFTGTTPDSVILVYAFEEVGTVDENVNASTFSFEIRDKSPSLNGTEAGKYVSFYPSLAPNDFYEVDAVSSLSITITKEISSLKKNAKIFRVNPIQLYIGDNELRMRETATVPPDEYPIIYDVQDFQLAYTAEEDNLAAATWVDNPGNPEDMKAVWIYLLLRTREIEPGHREARTFRLPWDAGQTFNGATLPAGFHYQEFQTKVWLRNAN